jgi:hypothetical protein
MLWGKFSEIDQFMHVSIVWLFVNRKCPASAEESPPDKKNHYCDNQLSDKISHFSFGSCYPVSSMSLFSVYPYEIIYDRQPLHGYFPLILTPPLVVSRLKIHATRTD